MPLCVSCQDDSDVDVKPEQMNSGETCSRCGFTRAGDDRGEQRLRFYSLVFAWIATISVLLILLLG